MNTIRDTEVEWQLCIRLDAIRVDPAIQQRAAGTSQDVVDEYAEPMRSGAEFPPIDVFFNSGDGGFDLADGFHRLEAHRLAYPDAEGIQCRIHSGDRDDALLFACGANAQHGLPRSRSDKLKAVTALIRSERWSGWSDREIARQCAVSHTYVAAVRSHLATFPDAGQQEQADATDTRPAPDSATDAPTAAPVRRRTAKRGGKRYKLNTAPIGRGRSRPQDEVAKLKRAFERFQQALSGASEPARQTFVDHCREEIMAIAITPEPPNPEPPNSGAPHPANPERPSPAEVEASTVPPAGAKAHGVGKPSRFTRGSAPNRSHKNAPGRHRFGSDNQPPKRGRPKGSTNRYSRDLQEDLWEALERVGRDGKGEGGRVGYLMWLAREEPKSCTLLLRGTQPAQIRATMTLKPELTLDEALAEMRARGLRPELIENLLKVDDGLGPDDEPNPYDHEVIDLKPEPPAGGAK